MQWLLLLLLLLLMRLWNRACRRKRLRETVQELLPVVETLHEHPLVATVRANVFRIAHETGDAVRRNSDRAER